MDWTSHDVPFPRNRPLHLMIAVFAVLFALSAVSPTSRTQWYANGAPLAAFVLLLAFTYRRYRFSNRSYLLMLVFCCLHLYAVHYTYEHTPFDQWLKSAFHTKRSYYDRVVHFGFGSTFAYPIREYLSSKMKFHPFWAYTLPVIVILGFGGLFEIAEWLAAAMAGSGGEAEFVGLQGDIFDTQKDMLLGLIGGIAGVGILMLEDWLKRRRRRRSIVA